MYYFKDNTCYISINQEITDEFALEIVNVIQTVNFDDSISELEVSINSPGGSVMAGFGIYSELIRCTKNVTTINSGCALSIASIIFLAGQYRKAFDYSLLMIHNPFSEGEEVDSNILLLIKSSLVTILNKSFKTSNLDELMTAETWFSADQLEKMGIIDEVIDSGINVAEINISTNISNIYTIMNTYIKNKNDEMKIVNVDLKNEEEVQPIGATGPAEGETEIIIENEEGLEEEIEMSDEDTLKDLIAQLKDLVNSVKAENEELKEEITNLKNKEMEDVQNKKVVILNQAGVKITDSWMKLEIQEIQNLLGTISHKASPVIQNSIIFEKTLKDMSESEIKNLAQENPTKLVELYKAQRQLEKKK